ncbi:transmembrane protein 60 [Zophobas morio]|uniref:transmembrane protein 60 n=1 Tax=Zophobas morio TaxID=2755281 RepID=UPI003082C3D9
MVMHRALFTWFILLVFLIILSLRLETRIHWSWFLIFLPMWVFDTILLIDALFHIFVLCKHENPRTIFKNKNITLIVVALLKIAAQLILCLKLEYESLQLSIYHVLIPFWVLLPMLIINVSVTLYKHGNYTRSY